jgi:7-keto-8-aminopelargonate synthetase-like enzyme
MNLVLANLVDENCVIFSDDLNHASIIDGTHVSRARVVRFAHNDVADLDAKLSQTPASMRKYVLIEGVYSMDGDIARLDEILAVARRHRALVAVDEAHSAGTLGAGGRGVFEYFGIDPGPMVLKAGTLGKAFGACGGYIAGSHLVIDMLRCTARPFMFSTSLPSAVLAGANAAFEVLEQHPELVERVQANGRYVRGRLQELGFDTHPSETQIIPILIRDEQKLGQLHRDLKEAGIWVMAVEHPGVPRGQGRLRLSLSAEHTREQLDRLLEVLAVRGKARGII